MSSRRLAWNPGWLASLVVVIAACGAAGDDSGGEGDDGAGVFATPITKVQVEIDYEDGQAPYTGEVVGFGDPATITPHNLERLVSSSKTVTVPSTEAAMEDVGAIADESLTSGDALALAAAHRDLADAADTKTYYVLFVSGHFEEGGVENPNVLGVSIGDTGVILMFKDVIRSTQSISFPNGERFVEQTTLLHELAHAVGLVNNGVPMARAHQDVPHGAHCDDDTCVMYWANELSSNAVTFAQQYVVSSDKILFDDDCLADVDAITGGP